MKKNIRNSELCEFLPYEFCQYMDYVKSLKFEEEPNYIYLRKLFLQIMDKMNDKYDLKFSWVKNKKEINRIDINNNNRSNNFSLMTSLNSVRRKKSPFLNILHLNDKTTIFNNRVNTENEFIESKKYKSNNLKEKE